MMKVRCWIILGVMLLLVGMAGGASAEPKRVLLLHSFGRDFSPWGEFTRNFRADLDQRSLEPIDVYEVSLATARFGPGQDEGPFADYLQSLFTNRRLDLIVTIGGPAANFIQRYRQRLFPSIPSLLTGVEHRRIPAAALSANDTVVAISVDIPGVIENILRVVPDTNHIAVVIGNSPNEQFWLGQLREALKPFEDRVTFEWLNTLPFSEMLKRVAALPPKSAICFAMLVVDAAGVSHEDTRSLSDLHAATSAPIFSYIDAYFGNATVGGPLISVKELAHQSAGVARRILDGESPGDIKTPPLQSGPSKFDWRELQRWNITQSHLPPDSEILFRPATMWEQYRLQAISTIAIVLLQSLLISALLIQRRRLQAAELQSRSRLLEVIHLSRTATAGVMSASIAHELNQPLGAILSNAETAEILLEAKNPDIGELKEILADIRKSDHRATEIIRHLRGLLKKSEVELQEFDLIGVIETALNIVGPEATRQRVTLNAHHVDTALTVRADSVHLQQVILNLAMNAMDAMQGSPAGGRKLTFQTMLNAKNEVEVSVIDSGPGIPKDKLNKIFETFYTTKDDGTGLGLSIARTIIETYGGRIWAENLPTGGGLFRFTLPLVKRVA